jgi:PKD repeat protein
MKVKNYLLKHLVYALIIVACFKSPDIKACNVNANFSVSASTANIYLYTFGAYDSLAGYHYWDFGDGTQDTGAKVVHLFGGPGLYKIQLIVIDTNYSNCSDTITLKIGISGCNVYANFNMVDSFGHLYFTNLSSNATSYKWYFTQNGNSDSSVLTNPDKLFSSCSTVTILLKAFMNNNCVSSKLITYEPKLAVPYFTIERDTTTNFSGLIVDKSKYKVSPSYMWFFGDGDSSSSATPTHTYQSMGPFNLCLRLTYGNCVEYWCDSLGFDSTGQLNAVAQPFTLKVVREGQTTSSVKTMQNSFVKLFPNPVTDVLNIESGEEISAVRLISVNGQTVLQKVANETKLQLDLRMLNTGVYVLEIEMKDGGIFRERIMR